METVTGDSVWGGPTKRFFVSMLTRDIELTDALLDLIDNCVDGATRQRRGKIQKPNAYDGYEARLKLSSDFFSIADNCGGIPENAIEGAFQLGRPRLGKDQDIPTIGLYGIGMKRAIFKIGQEATVESIADDAAFAVTYSREWLDPENGEWNLPLKLIRDKSKKGVTITVPSLKKDIARQFGNDSFVNILKTAVSEHFGYLMQKGFAVFVNGEKIKPRTLRLYSSNFLKIKNSIRPYDFESTKNGVHVRVTVGFYRPLARIEEIDASAERPETDEAGISVICNDRLVLLNDKSYKTGWGDGAVPKYHPQFRSIAGFIVFSTDHPEKLPISTTKRDLEVGSDIYLDARKYCMEGLRECTSFTNRWKGMEEEAGQFFDRAERKDARTEVRLAADHGIAVRGEQHAKKHPPRLPVPETRNPMRRISFTRKETAIKSVSAHLFGETSQAPSVVGQECFDKILKQATR